MSSFLKTSSPICPVHFAGFESDTLRLQRAGWQLSMEQDAHRATARMAMKHEGARMYALTHEVSYQQFRLLENLRSFQPYPSDSMPLEFHVACIFNEGRMQIFPERRRAVFAPIDAEPELIQLEDIKFEDYVPFRSINSDAPEILVPQHSVPDLMEMILKMQDPKQKEIRERRRKEAWRAGEQGNKPSDGYNPQADIKAQIITIAG